MWTIRKAAAVMYLVGAVTTSSAMALAGTIDEVSRTEAPSHHRKTAKGRRVTTVTKKDHDSTIHMDKGGILAVRLEATPGTGYSWTPDNFDPGWFQAQGEPVREIAKKSVPGASNVTVFRFRAIKEGQSTLKFVLKRPFEKNVEPVDHLTFTVEVSAK